MGSVEYENQMQKAWTHAPVDLSRWLKFDQPLNSTSAVYENYRSCGGPACRLFGFSGYSSNSGAQFILVFDANQLPAEGQIPVMVVTVAPTSNFSVYFEPPGRFFRHGIVLCNSSTGPTKTIGAADTWFDVQYISQASQ